MTAAAGGLGVDEAPGLAKGATEPAERVRGELIAPAGELVDAFCATLIARPQTQRTYRRACRRLIAWLGPAAAPEDLTAANISRYHQQLIAAGLSTATVKKDRAAINSLLRWCAEHDLLPAQQARHALAVGLPRARRAVRDDPRALATGQYERLIREAQARLTVDAVAGARDLAIVLVLGDAGLRCEELAGLDRRDFLPARSGAKRRALDVRHGKGDQQRRVRLSERCARAIVRWDRERARALASPADDAPLFITLGRRGRDGTYTRVGGRCRQPVLSELIQRLGRLAELPAELRHPHALRHTCATELLRAGASLIDVRDFLGHASIKTTSIYLSSGPDQQEAAVIAREQGRSTLDQDRDAT